MTQTTCKWPDDCDYPDCGTRIDPEAKICFPQTTNEQSYEAEILALERLLTLLDDPRPGLVTWNVAVRNARQEVMRSMNV